MLKSGDEEGRERCDTVSRRDRSCLSIEAARWTLGLGGLDDVEVVDFN